MIKPRRPRIFDVKSRMKQVESLARWTLAFLIQCTPNPEEALAAIRILEAVLRKEYELTGDSMRALEGVAKGLLKEMYEGRLRLESEPPARFPEELNYIY